MVDLVLNFSLKALSETEWETRKKALTKTVDMLEETINAGSIF